MNIFQLIDRLEKGTVVYNELLQLMHDIKNRLFEIQWNIIFVLLFFIQDYDLTGMEIVKAIVYTWIIRVVGVMLNISWVVFKVWFRIEERWEAFKIERSRKNA